MVFFPLFVSDGRFVGISRLIDFMKQFASFLAELNLKIPLLQIGMLLLDLLNPFSKVRLDNALLSLDPSDHDDTFYSGLISSSIGRMNRLLESAAGANPLVCHERATSRKKLS